MTINTSSFYSHGKLLLTGEYFVLDGAKSLAIPTKKGQKMKVEIDETNKNKTLRWIAFTQENNIWFDAKINYKSWEIPDKNTTEFSQTLLSVLIEANKLTDFFAKNDGAITIQTHLEFPGNWGLGSSSTFINNLANWLWIDPFLLLKNTLGGSGFDIACASANSPIIYQLNHPKPKIEPALFSPSFLGNLYFIHLNQKKKSQEAIQQYKEKKKNASSITLISDLTNELLKCDEIKSFGSILDEHEQIVSRYLNESTIKKRLFFDYPHAIKSLGAWGGDFVLVVVTEKEELSYFTKKGFHTIIPYTEMSL
jgi:mevalonate kinase